MGYILRCASTSRAGDNYLFGNHVLDDFSKCHNVIKTTDSHSQNSITLHIGYQMVSLPSPSLLPSSPPPPGDHTSPATALSSPSSTPITLSSSPQSPPSSHSLSNSPSPSIPTAQMLSLSLLCRSLSSSILCSICLLSSLVNPTPFIFDEDVDSEC